MLSVCRVVHLRAARQLPRAYARALQTTSLPPLPEQSEWRTIFNPAQVGLRERISVSNPDTSARLADNFLGWTNVKEPRVVIEAFPGPGALTRALLELPESQMSKLIVLEDNEKYLEYLKPLELVDPRVKVLPYSGHSWDTYNMLEDQGLLDDVPKVAWDKGVPNLHFISHIPQSVSGEQLVNQFYRCIPDQTWLFKYGRVPMNLIMGEWVWQRSSAGPLAAARCKLSVISEATAHSTLSLPPSELLPYDMHFHPTIPKHTHHTAEHKPENRKIGHPLMAVNILPLELPIIDNAMLEKWDYCLRRLFVLKSQSLRNAIASLAPGAQSLIRTLTDKNLPPEERIDTSTQIRRLTIKEWALIIRAFNNWPFAPEDLLIHDAYNPKQRSSPQT